MNKKDGNAIRERARAALVGKIEREQLAPMLLAMCGLLDQLMDEHPQVFDSWHPIGKKASTAALTMDTYLDMRGSADEDPNWIRQMRDTVARYKRERVKATEQREAATTVQDIPLSAAEVEDADASAFEIQ
jgi:hypothetical protein